MGKGRFDVGDVFSDGFRVWWRNIGQLVSITLAVIVPGTVLLVALVANFAPDVGDVFVDPESFEEKVQSPEFAEALIPQMIMVMAIVLLMVLPIYQIVLIAVTRAVADVMDGRKIDFGRSLGSAFQHFFPVLAAVLITIIPMLLGFALCILPGFCLVVLWYIIVPTIVVEGRGPIEALGRSWELVKSQFGYVLLIVIALIAINMALGVAVAIFGLIDPVMELFGQLVTNVLFTSLAPVFQCVVYYHLKRSLEGGPTDQVANVFE